MNETEVTKEGLTHVRPGREATTGVNVGPDRTPGVRRHRGGEQAMVPEAEFRSYYGRPVVNRPVWQARDVAGYIFVGGLGGVSSVVAAAAQLTGRPRLATVLKVGSTAAAALSGAALVHDLGRPARFLNMLRTFKPTSPLSIGSWLLAAYAPASAAASLGALSGRFNALGVAGTAGAALLGPAVATYTAALFSNTAVPAWHDGYREMPFVFASSAATSAAGLGMLGAPLAEAGPVQTLGVVGAAAELVSQQVMEARMGLAKEAFTKGAAKRYGRSARGLLLGGMAGAVLGRRNRLVSALSGAALLAGSALTRFAIFEAGLNSADDPKYTVVPQRQRLAWRAGRPAETDGRRP